MECVTPTPLILECFKVREGGERRRDGEGGTRLISLPFEFFGPVPRKFMVGAVGHFTLQPMARTNHKFPGSGGRAFERKRNRP